MNIAFIGVGGVGGYFGSKMAQLLKDTSVDINLYFIARGAHLEQIRDNGLKLKTSDDGEMICNPTLATDNINDLPQLDVCFICVKQYDLDNCLKQLKDKVGKKTRIVPLLNGVDIYDRIRRIITEGIVFPACVYVGTYIEAPGVVSQGGGSCTIIFGKDPNNKEVEPSDICNLMSKANIKFQWSEDHIEEIWSKYIFIAAYGLVTASENKTLGEVFENKELSSKVLGIMNEIVSISKVEGVNLPEDIVEKSYNKAKNFPFNAKTSFQRDFEKKVNRDERELFGQTVIDLGKKHNISTPVVENAYKKLSLI
ncbi:MAG: ketopantoate reductase family protein [Clostridiaceae bacterium]